MANNKGISLQELLERLNNNPNNLGIPGNGYEYQNLTSTQDATDEFFRTQSFLKKVFLERIIVEAPELVDPNMTLQFINYGDTQQVYVLTANGKQWSVLVTQPGTKHGTGKREFDNLRHLATINSDVIVKPEYYFEDKKYSKEELENKLLNELEEELEMLYKISQYADEHKRRDVVVNETSERFISHINIRSPN